MQGGRRRELYPFGVRRPLPLPTEADSSHCCPESPRTESTAFKRGLGLGVPRERLVVKRRRARRKPEPTAFPKQEGG